MTGPAQASIVFSQRDWTGAGDLDDCWVLSTLQAVHACAPWLALPTVPAVRKAAGDPDDGKMDGGSQAEIRRAIVELWPVFDGRIRTIRQGAPAELRADVEAGRPASVALMMDKLPPKLQHGAGGSVAHQATLVGRSSGRILFANPMTARTGDRWDVVSWTDVMPAIRAYGSGTVYALTLPPIDVMARFAPGVDELVRAAAAAPDPAVLAAARRAGELDGWTEAKDAAAAAIAALPDAPPA